LVISAGRLDYQKGYDYLIPAWSAVAKKHPDWHLNIYGEGALRDSIQKQIDELKLTNVITLCGRTSDISEKYAQHSIYVMSSRAEGLGLVLLEAASCGLPLIAYDCPSGPSEIIENGKNGLLVGRVGDIKGMADAICTIIENEALRNEMGEKALQMVERFSIQNIKKEWMEVLAGV
jgi:glycosyltransferase involved in cell wall biosynthesis